MMNRTDLTANTTLITCSKPYVDNLKPILDEYLQGDKQRLVVGELWFCKTGMPSQCFVVMLVAHTVQTTIYVTLFNTGLLQF